MRLATPLILCVALLSGLACNEFASDQDGDGTPDALDCDELNPTIHPDAPEICDGIDNDCDGEIDEDADGGDVRTWYSDADGDGFGDSEIGVEACSPPAGTVDNGDDCDDTDGGVNPDAIEDCTDGVDNDCDGEVDESDDADGDGVAECDGDCNDDDPDVFPGAEELCDGIDTDCDGALDNGFDDLDGDGFALCIDCDDDNPLRFPGNLEICDAIDNDCDALIDNGIDEDQDGFPNNCGEGGLVDILVVIDDSCSMEDEQGALAANAPALFEDLVAANADYNIALITTTDPAFQVVVDARTSDAAGAFAAQVPQGNEGNNVEQPFLRAVQALATQPDWRRPGAGLSLLVLSDEDDQSPLLGADFLSTLAREVTALPFLKINHISGLAAGCDGASGSAIPAPRLVLAGDLTGGDSQSICDLDWDLSTLLPELLPEDCDDTDPNVFSGAPELCDSIDNNCDGAIDEDFDLDGFTVCAPEDCDDTNPRIFSSAPELCDGIDNDCDGVIPESDLDGDGAFTGGCLDDALFPEDCDDNNVLRFPGNIETCTDGLDNDCDGAIDLDLDGDSDGDLFDACQDCDDTNPNVFPFAPELMADGIDNDCDGLVDTFDVDEIVIPYFPSRMADEWAVIVPLQAPYTYCGGPHDTLLVSSNGFVQLGPTGGLFDATPTAAELGQYAPFVGVWADYDPSQGGEIVVSNEPDQTTIRWKDVPVKGAGATADFDIRLAPGEVVEVRVRSHAAGTSDLLVGASCGETVVDLDLSAAQSGGAGCVPMSATGGSAELNPDVASDPIVTFCPPQ